MKRGSSPAGRFYLSNKKIDCEGVCSWVITQQSRAGYPAMATLSIHRCVGGGITDKAWSDLFKTFLSTIAMIAPQYEVGGDAGNEIAVITFERILRGVCPELRDLG